MYLFTNKRWYKQCFGTLFKKWYKVLDCFHHFINFCTCIKAHAKPLAHSLREVGSDGLGHAEAAHLLRAKDLGHLLVGDEVLLVVGVLKRARE